MNHHELKIDRVLYKDIAKAKQTLLTTSFDKKYEKGDILILQEHVHQKNVAANYLGYTGEAVKAKIIQTLQGRREMGLTKETIIVSFKLLTEQ